MNVVTVLRSGGRYTPAWVKRLATGIRGCTSAPVTFHCLTDTPIGDAFVREIPLTTNAPGWWAKMEMFRPGLFEEGVNVYLDLDTLVLRDLAIYAGHYSGFAALEDFFDIGEIQTAVMIWTGAWHRVHAPAIWDAYRGDKDAHRKNVETGDQSWLRKNLDPADKSRFIQDLFPGTVVSWKAHGGIAPAGARLLCFHGEPKQDNFPPEHWVFKRWVTP